MPRWLDSGRVRCTALDLRWARFFHRAAHRRVLHLLSVAVSRIGDGPLWVLALSGGLLFGDERTAAVALGGLYMGAANLLIYWTLKRGTRRTRPCHRCEDIIAYVRPADRFSFPSGHTLHAVSFALLLGAAWPALAPLLWFFAVLVGLSRVVLGVHYPSDVLAGAAIGALMAQAASVFL
jgi:undecaprenyl-diphosphatase